MKKILLLLIIFSFSAKIKAQVIFSPPGAEWHFLFNGSSYFPGNTINESIRYTGDSIVAGDNAKILTHSRASLHCGPIVTKTVIKQKDDTLFFRNTATNHTWQILYNFACTPGQTWQATISGKLHTFTVQSIGTDTENGFNLKSMNVKSTGVLQSYKIKERFGSAIFMFMYVSNDPNSCHGYEHLEFLCYRDNSFGLKQFGEKSCTFYTVNSVSIGEEELTHRRIKTFPNPVSDFLNVEIHGDNFEHLELSLVDLQSQELKKLIIKENDKIDLNDLKSGMYLITISQNKEVVYKEKLIKE